MSCIRDVRGPLIGIDQGEVISPLLWCIYYDPLLVEIHSQNELGYTMRHSWKPDLTNDIHQSISVRITAQAYMDDTTWISHTKSQLESTLSIADEFYRLNNIQVNKLKSVLLTNDTSVHANLPLQAVQLSFGNEQIHIHPVPSKGSTRVLGVWINLTRSPTFVKQQLSKDILHFKQTLRFKRLTDKHLCYIYN